MPDFIDIFGEDFENILEELEKLTPEQVADVEKLLEKLDDDDDVQNVYHTMEESTEE